MGHLHCLARRTHSAVMHHPRQTTFTDLTLTRRAICWLLLLAPLFYVSYGVANWLASQRASTPEIVFFWEKHIPFWNWSIIPYWSLNLFYAIALLACQSRHAQNRLVGRYLTVQLIAPLCFIAFPLTMTWIKPETRGVSGWLFTMLGNFDQPFNQAPSLHIALLLIIWDQLRRLLPDKVRLIWHGWCLLIGLSVLTTWQHHVIDIPAGLLLGLFAHQGKLFGKHHLSPKVSPSKTWEGLIGGVASASLLGAALSWLTPFTPLQAGLLAAIACIMGFFGGLVASAIKRNRGVKVWGHIIEGHGGGVMDRADSLVFAAPVFFHLVRYFWT